MGGFGVGGNVLFVLMPPSPSPSPVGMIVVVVVDDIWVGDIVDGIMVDDALVVPNIVGDNVSLL
jgi:hypothetical protein